VHDLSPRVALEERLRASEERWRAIVESAVDAIIVIDGRGQVEAFNPAAERLFGYTTAEATGRNVSMLMPSPYREEHDGYLDRYQCEGTARIIGIGREVTGRRKDGSTFPLHLSAKVTHAVVMENLRAQGFVRVSADTRIMHLDDVDAEGIDLTRVRELLVVVDRLTASPDAAGRLADVRRSGGLGGAIAAADTGGGDRRQPRPGGGPDGALAGAFRPHLRAGRHGPGADRGDRR
jgi:PAS domain S-box-containing protein